MSAVPDRSLHNEHRSVRITVTWLGCALAVIAACTRTGESSPRVSSAGAGAIAATPGRPAASPSPRVETRAIDPIIAAIPRVDARLKARLRAVYARGASRGMRPDVFAKIGDSITESASFLHNVGHGWYDLAEHADLRATVDFFHQRAVDSRGDDSFVHASQCAVGGWTSANALSHEGVVPLSIELDGIRPAFAIIMYGSNDVDRGTPQSLAENLARIIDECVARGVVPVLSTIPDRRDSPVTAARVPAFNEQIVAVSRERSVPLMEYHAAMASLPALGLNTDGVHPNVWVHEGGPMAGHFNREALRYGYNVRNYLWLRTLQKLRAVVALDGAADR